MPLDAVRHVLAGYRTVAALPDDASAEGRILRYQLHFALIHARDTPQPRRSWGERPLSYLLAVMRCLLASPGSPWGSLRP